MKLPILSLLLASAAAFTSPSSKSTSTSLNAEKELMTVKPTVPCFGATPLGGEPVFIGKNYWDKLTSEYGSEATGTFIRAAELKHGRSAMLAVTGFAFHKLGLTFNNISPHEYLSVTKDIKFADLQAMSPVDAVKLIPSEGWAQIFAAITIVELYELTHSEEGLVRGGLAPGLKAGGLTGDLGFNPLKVKITDRRRLSELQNGRAAMFAISAWVANECVSGSVPIPLPW
mmetsp:Transcript_3560/g.4706  ORF Transcript_3560/g.4706 Transcript_3560/m.4706 type:complete len:229 (+) Transcript_3560:60-746(+)